ncbi:MAG TPA: class I SAM-dependent methyltransferase [Acidimicrobiales bacterium]|nr:class I SAM-dependent methyltransferase [Acidimicrobiales bacterium]
MGYGQRATTGYRDAPNPFAQRLFAPLPRRYNRLAAVLSLGQDPRWRAAAVRHIAAGEPRLVLDVACGPCAVTESLARTTSAHVVGLDLSEEMLRMGQHNVREDALSDRVSLVLGRGEQLPFADASFDAVSFTYLLRYVSNPEATLAELARVVKPGGAIASLEFAVPPRATWRALWWLYTRAVLPAAGWVLGGRGWWDVGRFLGPNITQHYQRYPVAWTVAAWQRAGIQNVTYRYMSVGGGVVITGYRSG